MAERPLECCDCRKPSSITFVQVSMNGYNEMSLCSDCPLITRLLSPEESATSYAYSDQGQSICCGNCSTTMEMVQMGSPLGCAECYEVFADVICAQILKVPVSKVIHCGRSAGEYGEINPTLRLYALNEALQETLLREEYEEAARIRDEIKALMDSRTERLIPQQSTPTDTPDEPSP